MSGNEHALARYDISDKNADFDQRVVAHTAQSEWIDTDAPGVNIKLLEAARVPDPRVTMLIRFAPGSTYDLSQHHGGEEFLVLKGTLTDERGVYAEGCYVRNPAGTPHIPRSDNGCLLFVKLGEFGESDLEHRIIDTHDTDAWLPGPIEGTQVIPLHMHDSRSVLMIRWEKDASFTPGLDPQGEEMFVVDGTLEDDQGIYESHSWIRNPISAWQSWKGRAGTVTYYKNGHFPADTL